MAVSTLLYGPPVDNQASTYYRRRAVALTGATPGKDIGWYFEDWDHVTTSGAAIPGWSKAVVNGTVTPVTAAGAKGGRILFDTTSTASRNATLYTGSPLISNISTQKWYFACRQSISTQDSLSTSCFGFLNVASTKAILCGHIKALTPTNFGVAYDGIYAGTGLDLAVAKDTSDHIYEVYSLGDGVLRARLDEGAEVSATMASAPTDPVYLYGEVQNDTTAASRQVNSDFVCALYPR